MSYHKYFQRRLAALPEFPKIRTGYELIEIQPGQFLLHSGLQSFEIKQAVPGISLPQLLAQLTGEKALEAMLENMAPVFIAFFLDILEIL